MATSEAEPIERIGAVKYTRVSFTSIKNVIFIGHQHVHTSRKRNVTRMQNKLDSISDVKFTKYVLATSNFYDLKTKCGFSCFEAAKRILFDRIVQLDLSTTHYTKKRRAFNVKPVHLLKCKKRTIHQLREKLEGSGREYICELCHCEGMTLEHGKWLWRDWPLVLQIDHINGVDGTDNQDRLENLRYLCPSCHTQTSNYAGKSGGKLKGKKKVI